MPFMKFNKVIQISSLVIFMSSCASQTQQQSVIDNTKRLELLIEKERKENDQLNANRSILEGQVQNLTAQVQKLQTEKEELNQTLSLTINKSKEEKNKLETKIKALEGTVQQQSENNRLTVEALGEKINDLADDKRELINEKYTAKKAASKKKRRRR
jgi:uncharacterized protein YqgV (UPF0045/DUF77 family)